MDPECASQSFMEVSHVRTLTNFWIQRAETETENQLQLWTQLFSDFLGFFEESKIPTFGRSNWNGSRSRAVQISLFYTTYSYETKGIYMLLYL